MGKVHHLTLMYITNDLNVALIAQKYGVERVWVDLETLGKERRQKNQDSVKSHHQISDIAQIVPHLTTAQMMVRVNPWNPGSKDEIESVLAAGAQIIMLPYWKTAAEVQNFLAAVKGRCTTSLLLETKEAEACLDEVLELPGIDEIHIGLNDLHLSYGLNFMFECLTNGTVERICKKIADSFIANFTIPQNGNRIPNACDKRDKQIKPTSHTFQPKSCCIQIGMGIAQRRCKPAIRNSINVNCIHMDHKGLMVKIIAIVERSENIALFQSEIIEHPSIVSLTLQKAHHALAFFVQSSLINISILVDFLAWNIIDGRITFDNVVIIKVVPHLSLNKKGNCRLLRVGNLKRKQCE